MATEILNAQAAAAANIYFSVFDATGKARDFADNEWKALNSFAVNGVTSAGAGSGAFRVAGDQTALLTTGKKIRVRGSTGNDGVYTIRAGSAFAGGNTTINVVEAVPDATADGTVDLNATPYLTATELTGPGAAANSLYVASLDMALLYPHGVVTRFFWAGYTRAGAAPVPATDTPLAAPTSLDVQFGERGAGVLDLEVNAAFTTTGGTDVRVSAVVTRNGQVVPIATDDATATLAAAVREWGSGADLFTIAAVTVNTAHTFELEKVTPGFTADRVYKYTFTLTENGQTFTFVKIIPCHG